MDNAMNDDNRFTEWYDKYKVLIMLIVPIIGLLLGYCLF